MSVEDPSTTYHPDNLQQAEDIPSGPVVAVIVISGVVSVIGGIIAWFLLIYFYHEQRPNMSTDNFPEHQLGVVAEVEGLAIEQENFSLPVQPGEAVRKEQVKALHSAGAATVDANATRISIEEAKKRFIEQQKGSK